MEQFKVSRFVGAETLEFSNDLPGVITLQGEIACLGNIIVTVEKYLRILGGDGDNAMVQTFQYSYNVSVRNEGNIFRYDNSHDRPGHADRHHKHEFDDEGEQIIWIGYQSWRTLGQVLQETQEWYWLNRESLELPDTYPILGLRASGQNPET
jgi:Family of unknown function (DUF6516)